MNEIVPISKLTQWASSSGYMPDAEASQRNVWSSYECAHAICKDIVNNHSIPKYCSIVTFYCFVEYFYMTTWMESNIGAFPIFSKIISSRKCCLVDAYACYIDLVVVCRSGLPIIFCCCLLWFYHQLVNMKSSFMDLISGLELAWTYGSWLNWIKQKWIMAILLFSK